MLRVLYQWMHEMNEDKSRRYFRKSAPVSGHGAPETPTNHERWEAIH